jgi:phosphate transport system protein
MNEGPLSNVKRPLDDDIASVKSHLQEMGEWAIDMLNDGMESLATGDVELARKVVSKDDRLDAFDVDIEHEVIRVLVTRQPAARDARTLGACLKVGTYLDRVGRLGLDIAKYVRQSPSKDQFPPFSLLQIMQDQSLAMLRVALAAFDAGDVEKARAVYEADDAVDELNRQVIKECIIALGKDPGRPPQIVAYVLVSRHLERVADNACKIAEKTIYMETGHRRREFLTPDNKVAL